MEFHLLGPVEAWHDGRKLCMGGPKPRALLACLLLEAGRVVPTDRLVDAIWGESPPSSARELVWTYASVLRRGLTAVGVGDVIVTRPPGYLVEQRASDLAEFERLAAHGRTAMAERRYEAAAESLGAALALWRGPALGGIGDALRSEAARLDEARLMLLEERISADLAAGRESALVGELTGLVSTFPTRERLRLHLMTSLYRLGRQSDALAVYQEGRDILAEELGIDPGPELRQLHESILRADPTLLQPPAGAPLRMKPGAHAGAVPIRQSAPALLPPTIPDFTSREGHIAKLVAALSGPNNALPVQVISGKGGVGKSALAVRVAHEISGEYPDGQLYADLRGITGSPATPEDTLGRFLHALGVPPDALPKASAERADLFRSVLAGRRFLLMLDDAGSEQQVRPLLPGEPRCGVLITSRSRLPGLAGAQLLDLEELAPEAALQLLGSIAGRERVAAELAAGRRITELCGCLPLAIRTAGARLATRRHWTLEVLAERLSDERRRLDELAVGDLEVRASAELSYRVLEGPARVAFRRLGLLGVPDFAPWIIAPLLDVSEAEAADVLEKLIDAQLVDYAGAKSTGQPRYRVHDLLRVYAAERAEAEEPAAERDAAVTRVLGGWLRMITRVVVDTPPNWVPLRLEYPGAQPLSESLVERVAAAPLAWFAEEQDALVVGIERAAAMGLHEITCNLANALWSSVYVAGERLEQWERIHRAGLQAARRAGNRVGEARLLLGLGQLLGIERDRYEEAHRYFRQALALFSEAGDARGTALALAGKGIVCRLQGRLKEALHDLTRAGAAFRSLDDDVGIGHVGRLSGSVEVERGDYRSALGLLHESLRAYRRLGSRRGEALTLRAIGLVHRARGDHDRARPLFERALAELRGMDDELMAGYAVQALAKTRIRQGESAMLLPELTRALRVCREHNDRFGCVLMLRTLGELHLSLHRPAQARRVLTEAHQLAELLGVRLWDARVLRDLANACEADGDVETAAALRPRALRIFAECGAREYGELFAYGR
ncbi:AfsR/SARP family transcriptional regulator [Streptomyces sp. NPDC052396]|uniref:AfsR/SARP family transcriptional regulator n=1 Tax=Streptomyces sp. NPDC052396 TaxID=3365689 RepID=UPI0037D436FA